MALNKTTLQTSIEAAFKETSWTGCATKLALAIDTYIVGGSISGTSAIGATHIFPTPPGGSEIIPYTCSGTISTTGPSAMEGIFNTAFQATAWAGVGNQLGTAIDTQITSSIISITTYSPPLVGTGTGTPVTAAGIAALKASLESEFSTGTDWAVAASNIATAIDTFVKAVVITTTDLGTVPPVSWSGVATASIV